MMQFMILFVFSEVICADKMAPKSLKMHLLLTMVNKKPIELNCNRKTRTVAVAKPTVCDGVVAIAHQVTADAVSETRET